MTAYKLKKVLEHIARFAYPEQEYTNFYVYYVAKECLTVNATYDTLKRKITVYNFSRPVTNIMCSAIHELAHHICYVRSKNKKHDNEFYKVFKELLEAAILIGYVDYETYRKVDDTKTIRIMEQRLGKIQVSYNETSDVNKDYVTMMVVGGYEIKDYLTEKKFYYSALERIWEKDMHKNVCERCKKEILEKDPNANIVIANVKDLTMQVLYTAKVTGKTYPHKEQLKEKGYRYENGVWKKKFDASSFQEEYLFLNSLDDVKYKIG